MEGGSLEMTCTSVPDSGLQSDWSMACLRRRAWAQSRDSLWQEPEPESDGPKGSQQGQRVGDNQKPSDESGGVQNNTITSWLSECRIPLRPSLDDQSASPSRGTLKNGCSFEDDLSLGAEANQLHSSNSKPESQPGLLVDQRRTQFKERGRSMNSTGSGKSSTVSSVSELLDLYEEDPEEILYNLGFGQEEPDLSSKVPSRFFNNVSSARGIDIKVYLGAQLQRMELENPNYALTNRFRQIEVLTSVANEFFQLYSQVSGQMIQPIISRDKEAEGGAEEACPPLKRSSSALNTAKLLKKSITKLNLLGGSAESPEAGPPSTNHIQPHNGHAHSEHVPAKCHIEHNNGSTKPDHQGETANQKNIRKKDSCSLSTVAEETNGDGETDRPTDDRPEAATGVPQPASTDLHSANQMADERVLVNREEEEEEEENMSSTPGKAPPTLAPPQITQLRSENADSFDMDEVQSNEDEPPARSSRNTDLLRTVSQQSDSSGFAEDPSTDSNSYLKVQESSDSCDSETTVTSHPSLDVATPLTLDQPAFVLQLSKNEEAGPRGAAEAAGSTSGEEEHDGSSEQIPLYFAHQLPRNTAKQSVSQDEKSGEIGTGTDLDPEHSQNHFATEPQPEHTQIQSESATDPDLPTEGGANCETVSSQVKRVLLDTASPVCPPTPSSVVLSALNRAKQNQLSQTKQQVNSQPDKSDQTLGQGHSRVPLQRSSSLPSSLLSPSRIVSSVRIQFGQGQASCTPPTYSYKYSQEAAQNKEEEQEEEKKEEEEPNTCLSTLIINPSANQPPRPPSEAPPPPPLARPKPIPHYLMRSSYSLQSPSPPSECSPVGHAHSWSTQSVPDLSSGQQNPSINQTQITFPHNNPFPNPHPSLNPSPNPFTSNPPQNPPPLHLYSSLPNLLHPASSHHSSHSNIHHPAAPTVCSLSNLHHHHHHLHPGGPIMHHSGYSQHHSTPPSSPFVSPYLGFTHPHLSHASTQCPLLAPENTFYPGLSTSAPPPATPGFLSSLAPAAGLGHALHPAAAPGFLPEPTLTPGSGHGSHRGLAQVSSSTEVQLRRVLHDIQRTVQSLNQSQADTPDSFCDRRAGLPNHQSLFQQKRRSLNLFRNQMMDLELSIIQQQAQVYKHLSPADRLELQQLQSLREAVREELQELEDRLMELTQHTHTGFHRDSSVDSLSTTSALRAMDPMSDLIREQLFLQSELSYDGHAPSTGCSSHSSSPIRGGGGEQKQGVYRASVNIIPVPAPRQHTHTEEEEEEEEEEGSMHRTGGRVSMENLQQLIREIKESMAQEVRQEVYSELLAAVTQQRPRTARRELPL